MAPAYVFNDTPQRKPYVEKGDYRLILIEWKAGLSKNGNDKIELEWKTDGHGSFVYDTLTFTPKAEWKIDAFLRSIGKAPPKGQGVEFDSALLDGVTCWATLDVETYKDKDGKERTKNVVVNYILEPEAF